ncbi:hypothetical protein [Nitrosopumilus adriaticus]|uniref:hypothetical protein n=1 Tax=Nitrosopumilus adriaticus TaxID=1580092 RepID=UPI0011DE4413|nr:hypothetical protein [Nitrosopumilus adriaticus]
MDKGESRELLVEHLIKNKIHFIDVGIGLINENNSLTGLIRTTSYDPILNNNISGKIPFDNNEDNEYSTNIQVAEMNALSAIFAIIKWKKICGFYHSFPNENHSVYGIFSNTLTNEEVENEA